RWFRRLEEVRWPGRDAGAPAYKRLTGRIDRGWNKKPAGRLDDVMSDQQPPAIETKPVRRRGEVWLLGTLGLLGLIGFVVVFGLVMTRTAPHPQTATAAMQAPGSLQLVTTPQGALQGPPGERGAQGPAGPAGPRGANGEPGIRIVR